MVGNLNTWRSHWCWCHSLKIDWEPCIRDLKCATSLQLAPPVCNFNLLHFKWQVFLKFLLLYFLRHYCTVSECSESQIQMFKWRNPTEILLLWPSCKLAAHFKCTILRAKLFLSEWLQHQWVRQVLRFPKSIDFLIFPLENSELCASKENCTTPGGFVLPTDF